ncbi:hypothetical protein F2P79_019209 [Pimephales promelas]|nr:hypothetical protein F2P79_019209 [Pimephales promelas]
MVAVSRTAPTGSFMMSASHVTERLAISPSHEVCVYGISAVSHGCTSQGGYV